LPYGQILVFTADFRFQQVVGSPQFHRLMIYCAVSLTRKEHEWLFATLEQRSPQQVKTRVGAQAIIDEVEIVFLVADQVQRLIVVTALFYQKILIRNALDVFPDDEEVGVVVI